MKTHTGKNRKIKIGYICPFRNIYIIDYVKQDYSNWLERLTEVKIF